MSVGINGNPGLNFAVAGAVQHGSVNRGVGQNASVNFASLVGISNGEYNMGEIVVKNIEGDQIHLDIINNHVGWHAGKNTEVSTWQQRYQTNMAVFKALLRHYADQGNPTELQAVDVLLNKDPATVEEQDFNVFKNKHIKTAFEFLLGKDNLKENARPLSRDEAHYLIQLLGEGVGRNDNLIKNEVKRLNDLRAFKAGKLTDPSSVKDLVKGLDARNTDSVKRARVMQVSVNQRAAESGRVKPAGNLLADEEIQAPEIKDAKASLARGRTILDKEMPEVGHLVLKRVVEVAREYGPDLYKANAWSVAKKLSKNVISEITDAVNKYNATADGNFRIKRSHVAAAVIERMVQAVNTLLKDNNHDWEDYAWHNFAEILRGGLNRKIDGKAGYPASAREDFPLLSGKPADRMRFDVWGRSKTYQPTRGFTRTVAVEGDFQKALGKSISRFTHDVSDMGNCDKIREAFMEDMARKIELDLNGDDLPFRSDDPSKLDEVKQSSMEKLDNFFQADEKNGAKAKNAIMQLASQQTYGAVFPLLSMGEDEISKVSCKLPFPFKMLCSNDGDDVQMKSSLSRDDKGVYHLDVKFSGTVLQLFGDGGKDYNFMETGTNMTKMSMNLRLDLSFDQDGKAVVTVANGGSMRVEIPPQEALEDVNGALNERETQFREHQVYIRDTARQIRDTLVKQGKMTNGEAAKFDALAEAFAKEVAEVYGLDVGGLAVGQGRNRQDMSPYWRKSLSVLARLAMDGRILPHDGNEELQSVTEDVNDHANDVLLAYVRESPDLPIARLLALCDGPASCNKFMLLATDEEVRKLKKTGGTEAWSMLYEVVTGKEPPQAVPNGAYACVQALVDGLIQDTAVGTHEDIMAEGRYRMLLEGTAGLLMSPEKANLVAKPGPEGVTVTKADIIVDASDYNVSKAMNLGEKESEKQISLDFRREFPVAHIGNKTFDFSNDDQSERTAEFDEKLRGVYDELRAICKTPEQKTVTGLLMSQGGELILSALWVEKEDRKWTLGVEELDDGSVRVSFSNVERARESANKVKFSYVVHTNGENELDSLEYQVPPKNVPPQ